jgi:hypothetical protein
MDLKAHTAALYLPSVVVYRPWAMKTPEATQRYFFVDESGDSTFFDRHGNVIVGEPGCSSYLLIGYVRTDLPREVRLALSELRTRLMADPLFSGIPSFASAHRAFHAKDDSPEVRAEVFKVLRVLPLKAQFVFARKRLKTFRSQFHSKEGEFYDHLVTHLFKRSLHLATDNHIVFEKRGSRARQLPLTNAVQKAATGFESIYGKGLATRVKVECHSPSGEPCLQAADYFLWAVQRLFTKREDRFFRTLEPQIEFVWDLYDTENYPNNIYTKKNPLDINKFSPL